jgi:hypothetical protein
MRLLCRMEGRRRSKIYQSRRLMTYRRGVRVDHSELCRTCIRIIEGGFAARKLV